MVEAVIPVIPPPVAFGQPLLIPATNSSPWNRRMLRPKLADPAIGEWDGEPCKNRLKISC
jgi:hypothetical protein